jgi:hypothetical protein
MHRLLDLLSSERLGCYRDEEEARTHFDSYSGPHYYEVALARHVLVLQHVGQENHERGKLNHYAYQEGTGRIVFIYTLRKYVVRM